MLKIDAFNHIWPEKFYSALKEHLGEMTDITRRSEAVPMMTDLDRRFEVMDMFGPDYRQILSLASPPFELYAKEGKDAARLSRLSSEGMAELVAAYPDRFPGWIASPPMAAPEEMRTAELEYAVDTLGANAIQIFTNVSGVALDHPDFASVFAFAAERDLTVFLHPARGANFPDYLTEERSEYEIWWTFGWPYETSAAMARMVFSRIFDRHPGLTVVTHHAGGMVPFFEGRVGPGWDQMGARTSGRDLAAVRRGLKRPHLEYFKEFCADTASFGSSSAIRHAIEFFGEDRVLFASDAPFDPEGGPMYIRETIRCIDSLGLSDDLQKKIYQGNVTRLLNLPEASA
ncbi:amidohydrolase family protein [Rhodobacterales bacterium HKCCE3408]|nr:amidohydrolase family protein [Rhodobacterales bacterium HKCCE3408]